jgi:iron complex outermembrane receptor protein
MAIRMLALQNVQAAHRRLRSRVRVKATHADKKITSRSFGMLSFAITLGLAMSLAQAQQPTLSGFQVQQTQSVQAIADEGELPSITVTGYLIPKVGEGPQPVLTLDRDFISKQADQTVNDLLNRFTGGASDLTATTFTGNSISPASSAYGLRGLPASATLVLVDGYRFPGYPFPFQTSFIDLNSIPLAAVDRVEILKDGASSTYGSDAVAGVVNIVTKDEYNGADITNYFGISQRGDYEVYHGSFTAGLSGKPLFGGHFSLVTAFDYYSQSPIESLDRWYAYGDRSKLSPNYPNAPVAFFPANGGYIGNTSSNFYQLKRGVSGSNITQNDFNVNGAPDNTFLPIDEQLAARETRYGGILNASYSPSDWMKFYDRFIITRNEENAITPNQGFSQADGIVIPATNPYNPWGEALTPTGQLLREFGPWSSDVITRTLRNVFGLTVQLPDQWFIDASFLYGESDATQTISNAIIKDRLQQALNGTLDGFEGRFFNPFNDENLHIDPNKQFYDALRTQQIEDSRTDLVQWTVKSGGKLFELPGGPLTVAGGLEYRSESLIQGNDHDSEIGNITSPDFQGKLLSARRYVKSAYGEMDLPITGGEWSWPGVRNVDLVFSERYDNYSDFGGVEKPKFAVRYKPVDDLTFRATYAEGFIAPSLNLLFAPASPGLVTIFDPRKNQTYDVASRSGGNPNLQPETSYSYYAEALWTPASNTQNSWWRWAKGFSAYVDWYEILVRNQIASTEPQTLVAGESVFPGGVTRNAAGFITQISSLPHNINTTRTDGLDFGASYITKEYDWGKIDLELNATLHL